MQIPEIKRRLTLSALLAHYGLMPDHGNRLLCPFHADKNTRSLQLYPKTNTFYCFGCGKTGDVIDFVMFIEDLTKFEAIQRAEQLIRNGELGIRNEIQKIQIPNNQDYTTIFKTLRQNIFHYPQAQNYCNLRKINYIKCEIGYNPGNTFDKLKYCIVFPLKDKSGSITGLYGRSTINNDNAKHFYTPNRKGLYPGWPSRTTELLIITEAVIDELGIRELGIRNENMATLALFGVNGLTIEHKAAITNLPNLKEIVLFFDGDQAGREAAREHAATLKSFCPQTTIKITQTPDNEDINSIYIKHGRNYLVQLINNAENVQPTPQGIPNS